MEADQDTEEYWTVEVKNPAWGSWETWMRGPDICFSDGATALYWAEKLAKNSSVPVRLAHVTRTFTVQPQRKAEDLLEFLFTIKTKEEEGHP